LASNQQHAQKGETHSYPFHFSSSFCLFCQRDDALAGHHAQIFAAQATSSSYALKIASVCSQVRDLDESGAFRLYGGASGLLLAS
jgi:hypothetical protein